MALRLLVVEDRESLRRMLVRALAGEGYTVAAAADLAQARAHLAAAEPIDLVLSDLMLPDGSGLEVLTMARARTPAPPVVVLTGFGSVAAALISPDDRGLTTRAGVSPALFVSAPAPRAAGLSRDSADSP